MDATRLGTACVVGDPAILEAALADPALLPLFSRIDGFVRTPFHYACLTGRAEMVKLLLEHPSFDARRSLNLPDFQDAVPLHHACLNGHTNVVQLLLGHPALDGHATDARNWTCLHYAARGGHASVMKLLLPFLLRRVPPEKMRLLSERAGQDALQSPFMLAKIHGHLGAMKWLMAHDLAFIPGDFYTHSNNPHIAQLLHAYHTDKVATVRRLREELGLALEDAAALFALLVFLSESLLSPISAAQPSSARFFAVARRLPMEVQMRLCGVACRLDIPHLLASATESAFRLLVSHYPLSDHVTT